MTLVAQVPLPIHVAAASVQRNYQNHLQQTWKETKVELPNGTKFEIYSEVRKNAFLHYILFMCIVFDLFSLIQKSCRI